MFYGLSLSFERYPRFSAVMLILAVVGPVLLVIFGPKPNGPEVRESYDRQPRALHSAGGNYEYFGTQGYHCIGGKK